MTRGDEHTASCFRWMGRRLRQCVVLVAITSAMALSAGHHRTATATDPVADLALVDGRVVGDLVDPTGKTVVLLYEPGECFSCNGLLGRWIALGKDQDIGVVLVLTSQPTRRQTDSLAFLRVNVAGVLSHERQDPGASSAHLFDGTKRTRSAVGMVQQVAMLDEWTELASTPHPSPTPQRR